MSMFEDQGYQWRETYFVFFDPPRRPRLDALKQKLAASGEKHLSIANPVTDAKGRIESLTIFAPDDFAAIDISYLSGSEVHEKANELVHEIIGCRSSNREVLERLRRCEGRFDVLHFEKLSESEGESDEDDLFDPSGLLVVLEMLVKLTDGIAVDPQSGTLF